MAGGHHHSVRVASQRTGLSQHVIRIWERRYGAVTPHRTETDRRLYSEDQIERLRLLRALTEQGHSIGNIAKVSTEKLRGMAAEMTRENGSSQPHVAPVGRKEDFLARALSAVEKLDSETLEATLKEANVAMGTQALALRLVGPLAERIGELWREGALSAAHEHFATAAIRVFLAQVTRQFASGVDGPVVIVVTPVGQLHELGALLAAMAAANLGWDVKYLGASLPAAEIAGVARQTQARAVALSVVYPEDDPRLEQELTQLREFVGRDVAIVVGGRAASSYKAALKRIDAKLCGDIKEYCDVLDSLRRAR